jgi:hypothetical protein
VLDSAGRVPSGGEIWLTDGINYKFILKDANDVTIATYDNISGINSNYIAFTNSQEIQTATAGQTVFTLTTMQYQPGTNSLSVFVDGVNQYGPGATYAYLETDATTVTFISGLHVGAEVKFTSTQQQGAGAVDASQVSYTPPFTGSVATNVEVKLAQTVSVKDFGAVGDGIVDDTSAIQTAIDNISAGSVLYFPNGTYKTSSALTIEKSLTLLGDAGRQTFDNSWDDENGSVIHCVSLSDNIINVAPTNISNNRLRFGAQNLCLRGARISPGGATTGQGLYIDGRAQSGTAVHFFFQNLSICEAKEQGLYITGAVYGCSSINLHINRCGKNGLYVSGGSPDPIGEMSWIQTRIFENGLDGTGNDAWGLWYSPSSTSNDFTVLSCSINGNGANGGGAVFRAGAFTGSSWQFESNNGQTNLYFGSEGAGAGVTGAVVNGLAISPGTAYTGTVVNITSDANNVNLKNCFFGDTLGVGGKDVFIAGSNANISGVTSTHTVVIQNSADGASIETNWAGVNTQIPAFSVSAPVTLTNVTGDDTDYKVVFSDESFDVAGNFNVSTGIFTAPVAGKYQFNFAVTINNLSSAHTDGFFGLITTSRNYLQRPGNPYQQFNGGSGLNFSGSYLVDLVANDTAYVVVNVKNGTKTVGVVGSNYSWFSGYLVS